MAEILFFLLSTWRVAVHLRIGGHIVIDRIFEEYGIPQLLNKQFNAKEAGLFRDLVAYSIITESNVGQYYPDYAYNHSLFWWGYAYI